MRDRLVYNLAKNKLLKLVLGVQKTPWAAIQSADANNNTLGQIWLSIFGSIWRPKMDPKVAAWQQKKRKDPKHHRGTQKGPEIGFKMATKNGLWKKRWVTYAFSSKLKDVLSEMLIFDKKESQKILQKG